MKGIRKLSLRAVKIRRNINLKGLTDAVNVLNGCEKVEKTFWSCDLFTFRQCIYTVEKDALSSKLCEKVTIGRYSGNCSIKQENVNIYIVLLF